MTRHRIVFNVSGTIFETFEETINRYPNTLLGNKMRRRNFYHPATDDYFFDRNPRCFEAILYFYQSNGNLRCPLNMSIEIFEQECRFFEFLDYEIIEMKRKAGILREIEEIQEKDDSIMPTHIPFRTKICYILEKPKSSCKAWCYCVFSLAMIFLLILTAFIGTYPSYRSDDHLHTIEVALNIWFLLELSLRFIFNVDKRQFIRCLMNWIDLLSILPYFIFLTLHIDGNDQMGIFKTVKFIRAISLLRLTKHSKRLQIVGFILKTTLPHVKLQILSVIMMIFVAATFLHFAEHRSQECFVSIVDGLWWATQTVTSVGYGDIVPKSLCGKLFASFFMLFAVIIYVPVFSIGAIFVSIYQKNVKVDVTIDKSQLEKQMKLMDGDMSTNKRKMCTVSYGNVDTSSGVGTQQMNIT